MKYAALFIIAVLFASTCFSAINGYNTNYDRTKIIDKQGKLNYSTIARLDLDLANSTLGKIRANITAKKMKWTAELTPEVFSIPSLMPLDIFWAEFNISNATAPPSGPSKLLSLRSQSVSLAASLPSSFDLRNLGGDNYITAVKDQKSCGSCWAFSIVGAVEGAFNYNLHHNRSLAMPNLNLSEQELVSCDSRSNGCNGGSLSSMLYVASFGAVDESCFGYKFKDSASGVVCNYSDACKKYRLITEMSYMDKSRMMTPIAYSNNIANSTETIKAALVKYGPLMMGYTVYNDFLYYKNGTYSKTPNATALGGHGVVIVGYNDTGQHWIVKNSWGPGWGENGFFRLAYSNVSENVILLIYAVLDTDYDGDGIGDRADICPMNSSQKGACLDSKITSYCSDGTPAGKCTANPGFLCNASGSIVPNCDVCGCNSTLGCFSGKEPKICGPKVCSDGTSWKACSLKTPGYLCMSGGSLIAAASCGNSTACSDGTANNSCSAAKPQFCMNKVLANNCSKCGCPSGLCNATSQACYAPAESCGNGRCNATARENCSSCSADCGTCAVCVSGAKKACAINGCSGTQTCSGNSWLGCADVPNDGCPSAKEYCGNKYCNATAKENCSSCSADCGCATGLCNATSGKCYSSSSMPKVRELNITSASGKFFDNETLRCSVSVSNANKARYSLTMQWYLNGALYRTFYNATVNYTSLTASSSLNAMSTNVNQKWSCRSKVCVAGSCFENQSRTAAIIANPTSMTGNFLNFPEFFDSAWNDVKSFFEEFKKLVF